MNNKIIITGIGTDVGKTLVSAIVTKALGYAYCKPIQCGNLENSDAHWVGQMAEVDIIKGIYNFELPASPHLAAKAENATINLAELSNHYEELPNKTVVEGAGGIMVPLTFTETYLDWLQTISAKIIVVSRNYLGSINHSLLTAKALQFVPKANLRWLFNDDFMHYENDICSLSGINSLGKIPKMELVNKETIAIAAEKLKPSLINWIND
jgi:dethiobiotin synthetase